jgi:hypothetical protein
VGLLFPCHSETFAIAEISNFETPVLSKEEILRLEISMSDTHFMHVLDTTHELLEITVCFKDFELAGCQDKGVQVASGAVFHDFAVIPFGVLQEVESVDDIRMAKGGGNAEFRSEAFRVLLDGLLRTTSEFFDGIELLDRGIGRIGFVGYSYYPKGTSTNDLLTPAVFLY